MTILWQVLASSIWEQQLSVFRQQHDIEYQQGEHSVLAGLSGPGEDEPLDDYEALYPWILGMLIKFPSGGNSLISPLNRR